MCEKMSFVRAGDFPARIVFMRAYIRSCMDSSHRLPTDTDNGLLLIISGPSGVGKTTITRGVERGIADAVFSVSCTTRPKTDADVDESSSSESIPSRDLDRRWGSSVLKKNMEKID